MTTTVWNAGQKSVVAVHATEHTPSRWAYASDSPSRWAYASD